MGYYEGEIGTLGNCNNSGMWGGDGAIWAILLLALLGGRWNNNGLGGGNTEALGYELGKMATTNDVANGFAQNTLQRGIDDIILGQANNLNYINQGFSGLNNVITTGNASIQQTLCQGFNGVNAAILQSANATERGFAQTGYNMANCCCEVKSAINDVKYANEHQTCDIIQAINSGNQRIIDYMTSEKIDTLNRKLAVAEGQISQANQTNTLLNAINRTPIPAYNVPNPYCCYNYNNGCNGIQ